MFAPCARTGRPVTPIPAFTLCAALILASGLVAGPAKADPDYALHGESLSWRLDPPDGGAPSFLVGTMHMVDERLVPAMDAAVALLHEAGGLVVEVDMSEAGQSAVAAAITLPKGQSLEDIIGPDYFARLAMIAEAYGIPPDYLNRISPWGAAMTISMPLDQIEKIGAGLPYFDFRLMDEATEAGLPVEALESIDEQLAALAVQSDEQQADMLIQLIDTHGQRPALSEAMIERYVANDLAGLAALWSSEMDAGDPAATQELLDTLVNDRNRLMAERMAPLLDDRAYVVAIGAMHLPGEQGVLALLAEQGWTVTPLP